MHLSIGLFLEPINPLRLGIGEDPSGWSFTERIILNGFVIRPESRLPSLDGQTNLEPLLTDLPGMYRITVTQYHDLVERFDLAFADFYAVFPPEPPPTNTDAFASPELESRAGPFAKILFEGHRWPSAHLESLGPHSVLDTDGKYKLEKRYKDTPSEVFMALTPKAQAYYLPAFLQLCERYPDRSQGIPSVLLEQLTGKSKESEVLRAQLSPLQKRVVVADFENWYINAAARSKIKRLHSMLISD